jgi:hypothetical protein
MGRLKKFEMWMLAVFCFFSLSALGLAAAHTLHWKAVDSPDVAGYRVFERRSPASVLDLTSPFYAYTDVGKVLDWRTEVEKDYFYYYRLSCYNSNGGASDLSTMIFVIFPSP